MTIEYRGNIKDLDIKGTLTMSDDAKEDEIELAVLWEIISMSDWSWRILQDDAK